MTVIDTISSCSEALDPMIIFQGKLIQRSWAKAYPEAVFGVSNNGWTDNNHGFTWIKDCFDEQTQRMGRRLFIIDGHNSYVSVEFIEYCWFVFFFSLS